MFFVCEYAFNGCSRAYRTVCLYILKRVYASLNNKMDVEIGAENESVLVSFYNITYKVPAETGRFWNRQKNVEKSKYILKSACGVLRPARVTFILGPSGAGKTTLLNILAGRRKKGVTGTIVGGCSETVLVNQHASLIETMTARETLMFAAALKLPHLTHRERINTIDQVAKKLGIQDIMNTTANKLSGGEVKRLTIAGELITDPAVMLLDEPTSGLDSISSISVIKAVRNVAANGCTVACVVHQPSSKIYSLADDVILLSGGKTLYAGSVLSAPDALLRARFECPNFYNVADYFMEIAVGEHEGNLDLLEVEAKNYSQDISTVNNNTVKRTTKRDSDDAVELLTKTSTFEHHQSYPSSTLQQLKILLWRCSICATRDVLLSQIRVVCHFAVALLLGAVYNGGGADASRVASNTACLFFFILFLFFANAMPAMQAFPLEASVVLQQHLNKWYAVPAYCASKIIAEVPIQLLCATLFVIPAWWLTSQPWEINRILSAWLIGVLMVVLAQTLGLVVGAACGIKWSLFLVPASNIPMLMFSEFFIPFNEMPGYLRPIATISYFRYSFDAFLQSAYGFNREKLACPVPFCFFRYPQKYLDHLGLSMSFRTDILVLVIWIILLQFSLYVVLRVKVWRACR